MAFGIKVGSTFLDIDAGSQLTFEINTELWVTGEPTINVGSYSFPIDLPLTETNRYLLRFPERVDAYGPMKVIDGAVVYIGKGQSVGLPIFTGRLFVKNASNSRKKVSCFLIVEGMNRQNEKKFEDVDMGTYNLSVPVNLPTLMHYTINNPLDVDFVFFTVFDKATTLPNSFFTQFINFYFIDQYILELTSGDAELLASKKNHPLIPFLRLEVIMDRAVSALGYTLVNDWIGDDIELRSLCLFNNRSITDLDNGWRDLIRYNEHVPSKMLITEFLKVIAKTFFCGLFVNHYTKTITLRPYNHLLAQPPRHNWTSRITNDDEIEQDNTVPLKVQYATDNTDAYFSRNDVTTVPLLADGAIIADYYKAGGDPSAHSLIDGYYRVYRDGSIMRYDPSRTSYSRWLMWSHRFNSINIGGNGESISMRAIPMWMHSQKISNPSSISLTIPRCDIPLTIDQLVDDEVINNTNDLSSIRLAFYRGMKSYQSVYTGDYPYANNSAYDPDTETESYNHSLMMDGEKGIYNQYAKGWMAFLAVKKIVKFKLNLSIQDILNHREYDKVRIGNMDYFVKSIKVSVNSQGMGLSECTLVTVPFSTKIG